MSPPRAGPFLLVVALVLAGCTRPAPPGDGTGPGDLDLAFSGERAFGFARDQVERPDGSVRYRIADRPGNDAVADMLVENWTALGWNASLQRFTGRDFLDADKHPVIARFTRPPECSDAERGSLENMTLHNVEATLGDGAREIVVTAHYDTKATATQDPDDPSAPVLGADDGASGVAALWELARVLPGRVGNVTVTLVAFDAEDGWDVCYPSAGSTVYAGRMGTDRRDDVVAVVNLDMVGNASARFPREGYSRDGAPALVDFVWGEARRQNASAFRDDGPRIGDDHLPFLHVGVPAVDVIHLDEAGGPFPPYWHTTEDTLDKLDPPMLEQVGRVAEGVVLRTDRGAWEGPP